MTVVLVVGPAGSGASRLVDVLRGLLPEVEFVEEESPHAPSAVLAVLSAVAPATPSDLELAERAGRRCDLVIGVVAKIDAHRGWRDVLAANRALAAGRLGRIAWVGAAAAPDLGAPNVDDLVAVLRDGLADGHRNRSLRRALPDRRPASGAVELRGALQVERLRLIRLVRDRTGATRTSLREAAAQASRTEVARFEPRVRGAVTGFAADLDDEIEAALDAVAARFGLGGLRQGVPTAQAGTMEAPLTSRRLENRLTVVLGLGFGLGVALASSRLVAGLAPGLSSVGLAVGGLVGLGMVVWVAAVRRLLTDRAVLDRWVTEVIGTARWRGEMVVAERLLAAEMGLMTAIRARDDHQSNRIGVSESFL